MTTVAYVAIKNANLDNADADINGAECQDSADTEVAVDVDDISLLTTTDGHALPTQQRCAVISIYLRPHGLTVFGKRTTSIKKLQKTYLIYLHATECSYPTK